MSKNSRLTKDVATSAKTAGAVEEVFQALPPLGSDAYVEHISKATAKELPPEVLARALRQLPPESAGYEATLERLLRRKGKGWEYFGALVAKARRMVVGTHDHQDVVQTPSPESCRFYREKEENFRSGLGMHSAGEKPLMPGVSVSAVAAKECPRNKRLRTASLVKTKTTNRPRRFSTSRTCLPGTRRLAMETLKGLNK